MKINWGRTYLLFVSSNDKRRTTQAKIRYFKRACVFMLDGGYLTTSLLKLWYPELRPGQRSNFLAWLNRVGWATKHPRTKQGHKFYVHKLKTEVQKPLRIFLEKPESVDAKADWENAISDACWEGGKNELQG